MSDLVASLIRTAVPGLVGLVVGWLATLGVILPPEAKDSLGLLVAFVAAFLWYLLVRLLEQKWPALGVLLGVPKQPIYSSAAATPSDPAVITNVPAPAPLADEPPSPPSA